MYKYRVTIVDSHVLWNVAFEKGMPLSPSVGVREKKL